MSRPGLINLEDLTRPVEIDNKISLDKWYRIADNLLREAAIRREENNPADVYVLLVRYISLVAETIKQHDDYRNPKYERQRAMAQKKMLEALKECEDLKPAAMQVIERHNEMVKAGRMQVSRGESAASNQVDDPFSSSMGYSTGLDYATGPLPGYYTPGGSGPMDLLTGDIPVAQYAIPQPVLQDQLSSSSVNVYRPSAETLSRHSFMSNSAYGSSRYRPSPVSKVQYYIESIDSSPLEIPLYNMDDWLKAPAPALPSSSSTQEEVWPASALSSTPPPVSNALDSISQLQRLDVNGPSLVQLPDVHIPTELYRQPEPPPVAAKVDSVSTGSFGNGGLAPFAQTQIRPENVADPRPGPKSGLSDDVLSISKGPKKLHISTRLMQEFLRLASKNTKRNLETCGILAGGMTRGVFYVTTLIIPKQESTSDSCNTVDEETIFHVQDKRGLFQLGWIHTHPSQSCFMSSVDLHTHYAYQVMLPEAIAIVMAPTDPSRQHGIFRLSDPGGIKVIAKCPKSGFHPHATPAGGGALYEHSSHVFMNPKVQFDIVDLR